MCGRALNRSAAQADRELSAVVDDTLLIEINCGTNRGGQQICSAQASLLVHITYPSPSSNAFESKVCLERAPVATHSHMRHSLLFGGRRIVCFLDHNRFRLPRQGIRV